MAFLHVLKRATKMLQSLSRLNFMSALFSGGWTRHKMSESGFRFLLQALPISIISLTIDSGFSLT